LASAIGLPPSSRNEAAEAIEIVHHQIEPGAHDLRALLRRFRCPRGQGAVRGLDRLFGLGGA
jgi:hypothetical protein